MEVFPFPLPEGNPDYLYEETPADPPLETREEGRSIWQWEDLIAAQKADEILKDIWGWKQEEQAGRGGKPPVIRDSHPEREVLVRRWTKISVSPVPQSKYGLRALYYDHRLIVPLALRREIIKSAHTPGHRGEQKTTEALREKFYWPDMGVSVHKFVQGCVGCILKHPVNLKDHTHFATLAHRVGEMVAMDLMGPISKKITNSPYLLTCMDVFSRYTMAIPIPDKKADTVTRAFLHHWVQGPGGTPEKVVLDQGKEFTSRTTRGLLRDLGVEIKWVSVDNHQTNPVERIHRTLWAMCRSQRVDGERSWRSAVRTALSIYNQSVHSSTGVPPNRVFLGRDLQLPHDLLRMELPPDTSQAAGPGTVAAQIQDSMSILVEAVEEKQAMMVARNGKYYLHKAMSLEPGDLVVAHYSAPAQGDPVPQRKLRLSWTGPHVVLCKVNDNMIQLGVLRGVSRNYVPGDVHFVCHASKVRLVRKKGDLTPTKPAGPPAQLTQDVLEDLQAEVEGSEMSIYPDRRTAENRPQQSREGAPPPAMGPGPIQSREEAKLHSGEGGGRQGVRPPAPPPALEAENRGPMWGGGGGGGGGGGRGVPMHPPLPPSAPTPTADRNLGNTNINAPEKVNKAYVYDNAKDWPPLVIRESSMGDKNPKNVNREILRNVKNAALPNPEPASASLPAPSMREGRGGGGWDGEEGGEERVVLRRRKNVETADLIHPLTHCVKTTGFTVPSTHRASLPNSPLERGREGGGTGALGGEGKPDH